MFTTLFTLLFTPDNGVATGLFINKCQKGILRCAPPSAPVCDFYLEETIEIVILL